MPKGLGLGKENLGFSRAYRVKVLNLQRLLNNKPMVDLTEFKSISPYTDSEAAEAVRRRNFGFVQEN